KTSGKSAHGGQVTAHSTLIGANRAKQKNDQRESNVTMVISLIDGCALSGLHSQPLMLLSRNKQPKTGITKRRCRITSPKITILRGGTDEELDRNTFSRGFGRHFGRPGSGRERSRMGIPDSRMVVNKPPLPEKEEGQLTIEGSGKSYTRPQIEDLNAPPDWFPNNHPQTPRVVTDGRVNKGFACGSCHLMNGLGHPESGDVQGLTAEYFIQTMKDFKSGKRKDPIRMT